MGSADALDGFEYAVVCGACSFPSVTDVLGFCVFKHAVLRTFSTLFHHLRVLAGTVRGQQPRLCVLLTVAP